MITVVFFASLREELGVDSLSLKSAGVKDVHGVLAELGSHLNGQWYNSLTANNILIAVNQEMANIDSCVTDGDEIAFLPPVTGG